jgi:type IV pilus assembly protein PilX
MNRIKPNSALPRSQRGVALAVVLILLVVITLLALAAMRGTLLEERMSSNIRDRGLGFQAAEAALREGESIAAGNPGKVAGYPTSGCGTGAQQGYCAKPDPAQAVDNARWEDANWEANSRAATVVLTDVGATPRFMVELLQTGLPPTGSCTTGLDVSPDAECTGDETIYRITARSVADGRADVTLQSTYVVP